MRANRLIQALLFLQGRPRVTASELAAELEVSLATARRDLEALSMAGVPIYPQAGRGGGWSLIGGARTDLTGLTEPEAHALFLLAGPASDASEASKAALRKLLRAVPATFRGDAEVAAAATMVDPASWGAADADRPTLVTALQDAVVRRRRVRLRYAGRTTADAPRDRLVEPLGLVDKDGVWYLIADTDRGRRTFRVDRVISADATDERFERPADFRLADAWTEVVETVEDRRGATQAVLLIASRWVPILADHFGRHCTVLDELPDGRARVRVAAPTPLDIARTLAGWGDDVEVVEPAEVRAELGRIGRELAARYPSAS